MSAYIVENATIDAIVCAIDNNNLGRTGPGIHIGDLVFANQTDLGRAMVRLNRDSVNQRYGENETDSVYEYLEPPFANQAEFNHGGAGNPLVFFTVYKALTCYLYQTCEGNVPETPLFHALERQAGEWAATIISNLPQYDRAPRAA